ncbi:MAG: hypothetical protein O2954_04960 [bacterium]|nr:hypothetical protein [bacterium]
MSYETGIQALNRQTPSRLGHTEYCSNYALVRAVTGRDPATDPGAWHAFHNAWDIDLLWTTNDGPVPWEKRGRVTDMGHAEFLEHGADRRDRIFCPFGNVEDVLSCDAVEEYGLPDKKELIAYYEQHYRNSQKNHPELVYPGGYYKTIVSGLIQTFGWDLLLEAAADRPRFERVLDSFFRLSLHHYEAWAETSFEVFISHDDMVWSAGPFMHPDFYRSAIFPRYQKLWQPLRDAGKIVLYCSDGTWTEFVDDIAAAGAHGFIFEPTTSLDYIVEHYGKTHVIVGSKVDCRTLTFSTPEAIRAEIDATLAIAKKCPGFLFAVGNHIPSNVPVDNALYYFDHLHKHWNREKT